MMRAVFILWCRNKAAYVEHAARALLEQTSDDIDIVFSDHGSTDGSFEILGRLQRTYDGNKRVDVWRCPLIERRGVIGLNEHMQWAMDRIDADIIISASADDLNHPNRAEKALAAFANNDVDYVMTRARFTSDDQVVYETPSIGGNAYVPLAVNVAMQFGIQSGGAWTKTLWDRVAPMRGIEAPDLILPCMAAVNNGLYMIDEILHEGINVADTHGVSTERAIQAASTSEERDQLTETNAYQFTSSHISLFRRIQEMNASIGAQEMDALQKKLITAAGSWAVARDKLSIGKIEPLGLRT